MFGHPRESLSATLPPTNTPPLKIAAPVPRLPKILELYSEMKAYVTDLRTKQCTIYTITEPFHRHDVRRRPEANCLKPCHLSPEHVRSSTQSTSQTLKMVTSAVDPRRSAL